MSHVRTVQDLLRVPGNDRCADCAVSGVTYASVKLGVFLCENCANIHRSLGAHISRPKSLKNDRWEDSEIQALASLGNDQVNQVYEKSVSLAYRRPKPTDLMVVRDQWIRAKYERREFVEGAKPSYLSGHKEGQLWKRGKDAKAFQPRRFVLDTTENTLKYYNRDNAKDAKACMRLDNINVTIVPEKVGNPHGMQITFALDSQIRSLFVYAETAQDLIEWYTAIRAAKLTRLAIAYPSAELDELSQMVSRDFLREGWLFKTGPKANDAFRRRWFTLDNRRLMYFEEPLDPFPKGEVFVGTKDRGFDLVEGIPSGTKDPGFGFTLRTPERRYHFSADSDQDRKDWMEALFFIINSPLSPQDSKVLYRSTST